VPASLDPLAAPTPFFDSETIAPGWNAVQRLLPAIRWAASLLVDGVPAVC
jgi:hypothetical protein